MLSYPLSLTSDSQQDGDSSVDTVDYHLFDFLFFFFTQGRSFGCSSQHTQKICIILQHYKAIASATELPIVLYNVPGRTGVNMTAETTLRIAKDFQNVIAIKEASGNITQMDDIIKNKPANFDVISVYK